MENKRKILLKLTGEIFLDQQTQKVSSKLVESIAAQIKILSKKIYFGVVIGGGNFFRGSQEGSDLGLNPLNAHRVGILATMMNGIMLYDFFEKAGLSCTVFTATQCPAFGSKVNQESINNAINQNKIAVFTGGTGSPFFTTDTAAMVRALQIQTQTVWKATKVDGIYTQDPNCNHNAKKIDSITHRQAQKQKIKILDATAFALAEQHNLAIRVFNIFEKDALIKAANDKKFGSTVHI